MRRAMRARAPVFWKLARRATPPLGLLATIRSNSLLSLGTRRTKCSSGKKESKTPLLLERCYASSGLRRSKRSIFHHFVVEIYL